jgi:hypothetical protein
MHLSRGDDRLIEGSLNRRQILGSPSKQALIGWGCPIGCRTRFSFSDLFLMKCVLFDLAKFSSPVAPGWEHHTSPQQPPQSMRDGCCAWKSSQFVTPLSTEKQTKK